MRPRISISGPLTSSGNVLDNLQRVMPLPCRKKPARGRTARRGTMNGLETAYARRLAQLQAAGEVLWFQFEGISFRLAGGAHYTPDFVVQLADGTIELHETKGHWREAARVRIKVAAETFPFRFVAVKLASNRWEFEEF